MNVAELRTEIHLLIDEIDDEETLRDFVKMLREILKEQNPLSRIVNDAMKKY